MALKETEYPSKSAPFRRLLHLRLESESFLTGGQRRWDRQAEAKGVGDPFDDGGSRMAVRGRAFHERAAATHERAAALHREAANLQQLHAFEMEEIGWRDSVSRAERLADRERELERAELLRAELERERAAAAGTRRPGPEPCSA